MKTFHIYTDASSKDTSMFKNGVRITTKVGVIVANSNIVDIYYKRRNEFTDSYLAEVQAIIESINYLRLKYHSDNIIIHTDAYKHVMNNKTIKKLIDNYGIKIIYVRGHCTSRKGLKYKFNCLADWISRNGINNWRNYYYRYLLR